MHNYFAIIRNWIVFAGCFLLLFSGCEKQADTPESKKVISKKIVVATPVPPKDQPEVKQELPPQPTQESVPGEAPVVPEKAAEKDTQTAAIQDEAASGASSVAISKKPADVAYVYDPIGKIDPFAPMFRAKTETPEVSEKKAGQPERKPMTPLEKIALSQLKLVAVMIAPSGNKALVEEASGKGYIVNEGTYIGTNSGRVLSILLDKVVVEEEVEDVLGNLTIKKTEMKLQKTPGE